MKETKSIAVLYENAESRQTAINFCDGLVSRFWEQLEFDIGWWSFKQLQTEESNKQAVANAAVADIVLFATAHRPQITTRLTQWIELWLRERGEHEGALVNLPAADSSAGSARLAMALYLRSVAHRAGMDYLTEMPASLCHPMPESLDSCAQRAQQVTTLLDEILQSPRRSAPLPLS